MPVSIEEVTAEIDPSRAQPPAPAPQPEPAGSSEVELRNHLDAHVRLECRAARVRAD